MHIGSAFSVCYRISSAVAAVDVGVVVVDDVIANVSGVGGDIPADDSVAGLSDGI